MSHPVTVPDTRRGATQPPKLTLIVPGLVPGLVPGSTEETHSQQAWPDSMPAGDAALNELTEQRAAERLKTDDTLLQRRFAWQSGDDAVVGKLVVGVQSSATTPDTDEPWECALMRAVGVAVLPAERLPIAHLRWPLDFPGATALPQHIVCADPVHLQVERDSVSVIPAQALSITADEAAACAESINALLKGDGLELVIATPEHWYLKGCDPAGLIAAPSHAVARRNVDTAFSKDADSARWRQLGSELQMLLHSHPVNTSRGSRAQLAINSVWFCGGDSLPAISSQGVTTTVHSADAEVLALAQALGIKTCALASSPSLSPSSSSSSSASSSASSFASERPHDADESSMASPGGDRVWVDLSLYQAWLGGDAEQMAEARAALVQGVIVPALEQLDSGSVSGVCIEAGDGRRGMAVSPARSPSALSRLPGRLLSWFGIGPPAPGSDR